MKRRLVSLLLTLTMVLTMIPGLGITASAADLTITDLAGLNAFAAAVTGGTTYAGQTVQLGADIVADSTFTGIGNGTNRFAGTFDGAGHTISGLSITSTNAICGFFAATEKTAVIKDFTLNGSITNTASMPDYGSVLYGVGAVVGVNRGEITNVTSNVNVSVSASLNTGGIAGFNAGAVNAAGTGQYANAIITAENGCNGNINKCIVTGDVSGYHVAGGIAGENAGTIDSCLVFGDVSLSYSSKSGCGGIAGRNGCNNTAYETGEITNCAVFGDVDSGGSHWIGGIAGFSSAIYGKADATPSIIKNCYMVGTKGSASSYNNAIVGNIDGTSATHQLNKINNYSLSTLTNTGSTEAETGIKKAASWFTTTDAALALSLGSRWVFAESTDPVYSILSSEGKSGYPVPVGMTSNSATETELTWTGEDTVVTSYTAGQNFDMGSLALVVSYSDGTGIRQVLTADKTTLTEADNGSTVTVSDGNGHSKSFTITVIANSVNSISISTAPSNTTYAQDEAFDPTGMVVKAYYASAPSTAVTLTSSDYTVTQDWANSKAVVSYTYNGTTVTAEQAVTILPINTPALSSNYYQIGNAAELQWFANKVNTGSTAINGKLTANVACSTADGFVPVGKGKTYTGTFDGDGHTLSLTITGTTPYVFGTIGTGGVLKNINFTGSISSTSNYAAPVYILSGGTVQDITSNLTVSGGTYAAGMIAQMSSGTATDCEVTGGTVSGTGTYTGGFVAMIKGGMVTNCGNNAAVSGTSASSHIGGFVGAVWSPTEEVTFSKCYNKGTVTSAKAASTTIGKGGFAGTAKSASAAVVNFTDCYNTGDVTAYNCVGGICGYACGYSSSKKLTFTNCYSTGTITNSAGSVTGYTGSVIGFAATGSTTQYVTCTNCCGLSTACTAVYGSSSTASTFIKPTSKTSDELKALAATLGASYKENTNAGFNGGYPVLTWETIPEASHTHSMTAHAASAATCTTAGNSAYWYCSDCGKYFSDEEGTNEIEENSWVIEATGHVNTSTTYENVDENNHNVIVTCNGCQEVQSTTSEAHSWDEGTVSGTTRTYTCTKCNATKTETVECTHEHTTTTYENVDADNHNVIVTCDDCQEVQSTTSEAHTWDAGTVSDNIRTYTCTACGATKTESVTCNHTDANHDGICDTCEEQMPYNVTIIINHSDGSTNSYVVNLRELTLETERIFYTGTNKKPDPRCIGMATEYIRVEDLLDTYASGYSDEWTIKFSAGSYNSDVMTVGNLLADRISSPEWAAADPYTSTIEIGGSYEAPAVLALKSYHTNICNAGTEYAECLSDLDTFAGKTDYAKAPRLFFGQVADATAEDAASLNYGNLGFNCGSNIDTITLTEVHTHSMTEYPEVAATCTTAGNSAYWYCSDCEKYFSDEEGTNEIEENSWVIPATGTHSFGTNGFCEHCGTYNPDAADDGDTPAYLVTTAAQLREIARAVNAGDSMSGKTVKLGGDITVAAADQYATVANVAYGQAAYRVISDQYYITASEEDMWTPIGAATATSNTALTAGYTPFAGTFDGAGYTVSGIYTGSRTTAANTATVQGLFGVVTGTVKNVTVSGCVTAKMVAGGVVAYLNGGTIQNCVNNAIVFVDGGTTPNGGTENGTSRAGAAGGVCGNAMTGSAITGCANTAGIFCVNTAKGGRAGGILGLIDNASYTVTIENCRNSGAVLAYQYAGGIVGGSWSTAAPISGCYNSGRIAATSSGKAYAGGITSYTSSNITNCINTGDYGVTIHGTTGDKASHMGGIVSDLVSPATVSNCYNTGTNFYTAVSTATPTRSSYGSICGTGYGTSAANMLTNCYTTVNEGEDLAAGCLTLTEHVTAAQLGSGFLDSCPHAVLSWQTPVAHNEVPGTAVEATCCTAGHTAGSTCSVCGAVITAQETIPATGNHSYSEWTLQDGIYTRTCTGEGCTETQTCKVGDANSDGKLTASDAGALLLAAASSYSFNDTQAQAVSQLAGDGYAAKAVTVLQYLVGLRNGLFDN